MTNTPVSPHIVFLMLGNIDDDDFIHVNCIDYLENIGSSDLSFYPRPESPLCWRERLAPERNISNDDPKCGGAALLCGGQHTRNGGGGKVYIQNEFRSAHGAARNTSRAPSVHVDDFYSNQ